MRGDTVGVVRWGAPAKRRVLQRPCDNRNENVFHELTRGLHGLLYTVAKGKGSPD